MPPVEKIFRLSAFPPFRTPARTPAAPSPVGPTCGRPCPSNQTSEDARSASLPPAPARHRRDANAAPRFSIPQSGCSKTPARLFQAAARFFHPEKRFSAPAARSPHPEPRYSRSGARLSAAPVRFSGWTQAVPSQLRGYLSPLRPYPPQVRGYPSQVRGILRQNTSNLSRKTHRIQQVSPLWLFLSTFP